MKEGIGRKELACRPEALFFGEGLDSFLLSFSLTRAKRKRPTHRQDWCVGGESLPVGLKPTAPDSLLVGKAGEGLSYPHPRSVGDVEEKCLPFHLWKGKGPGAHTLLLLFIAGR